MDRKKIIETFERVEREAGGIAKTDASLIMSFTAMELNISRETVRAIMIDHWTMRGAG